MGILCGMMTYAMTRLKRAPWERYSQIALLILLAFAILWRGGRTLDVTLLLGLTACAVALSHGRRVRTEGRAVPPMIWWLTISFVLWTGLSYVFTTTMNYGFDEVTQTAALALLFLWMIRQPEDARVRMSVLRILVVTVLLACLIGVFVYAMGPVNRFVGTFIDIRAPWKHAWPNAWAELLLLTWPVALLLSGPHHAQGRSDGETFWRTAKRTTPAGVIVGCLLLSFSRAALIAFAGQGVLLLVWALSRRFPYKRIAAVVTGTLVIGLLIFGLSNHLRARAHAVQSLSERTLFLTPEGTGSITARQAFWWQAAHLTSQRPLFGWGPGSFRFAQTPLMEDVLVTSEHAHNVFLKAAAERGLPAALLLCALLLILIAPLFKGLFPSLRCRSGMCPMVHALSRIPRRELTAAQALLVVGLLGLLAHNLVDFNLHFIGISLPALLVLGMLVEPRTGKSNKKFVHTAEFVCVLILLFALLHEGFYAVTSTLGRRREAQGRPEQALRWYRWSQGEWYSRDLSLKRAQLEMNIGAPQDALRTLRRYTEIINAPDARGWALQAEAALALQDADLAHSAYAEAYARGRYTDLRIVQGLLSALRGKEEFAERKEEFAALLQHYYAAILQNSHFIGLSHNVEAFVAVAEIMAAEFPYDAPRYQVMAAGADRQAKTERARLAELTSQVLW